MGAQTAALRWVCDLGAPVRSSPAIDVDGTVIVGCGSSRAKEFHPLDGKVFAIRGEDGAVNWMHDTHYEVRSSPTIGADGTVYVQNEGEASDWNNMWALDPKDGSEKWSFWSGLWAGSPSVAPDGTVYFGTGLHYAASGIIYALNGATGSERWGVGTDAPPFACPAISGDGTVYVGCLDGNLYALDHKDGSVKWKFRAKNEIWSATVADDGTIYFGGTGKQVYAIDSDGELKWKHQAGNVVLSSPSIGPDGDIYVGVGAWPPESELDPGGGVLALYAKDGTTKWFHDLKAGVSSSAAIGADGTLYIGGQDSYVYAMETRDGSIEWKYKTGGPVESSPAIGADGTVYIGCDDGKLYAFGPNSR